MSEEPRRSGRATKGQHVNASSSPAPNVPKSQKSSKKSKSKGKKAQQTEEEDDDAEDIVRCICGEKIEEDKRAFIACEACEVWQHNVCMGMPEEEEEIPEHYFCEECDPAAHTETLAALADGERIWEARSTKHKAWKKMSASRRKGKGKGAEEVRPSWWKKDIGVVAAGEAENGDSAEPAEETGNKRKRESVKPEAEPELDAAAAVEEPASQEARPDKRRKSSQAPGKAARDADTAIVDIESLPKDRKAIAEALSKVIGEDLKERVQAGFVVPEHFTTQSLANHYASLIEYAMFMNHGKPGDATSGYTVQFRLLYANLKRNKVLIERLLEDSLTADELATMESAAMASEEKQREWKEMKEQNDRQVIIQPDEGPRYRSDHKGLEKIEDERVDDSAGIAQPVRDRTSIADDVAGSPANVEGGSPPQDPISLEAMNARRVSAAAPTDRKTSGQQHFDMDNIWQKTSTAQSPTTATGPRPMQMPPRRRSSVMPAQNQAQDNGAKDDPDIDRLLQDDEESYEPQGYTSDETVVWQGKVVHTGEGEPLVNARFVAGRDMGTTASWKDVLPHKMSVDGRLAVQKAEEYLCGLQWSQNSDVSVLALTPADNMAEFNKVFEYFLSRGRYAVINKDKPGMVKDIYIIPVEVGANLPDHITILEHNTIKFPVEDRMLLATFVVTRAMGATQHGDGTATEPLMQHASFAGNGAAPPQVLPQHMRSGAPGPAGSPLTTSGPTFSPSQQQPMSGYGVGIPPSPYEQQQQQAISALAADMLGPRQWDPTALQVLAAQPDMPRENLMNLRRILEENVGARTNVDALAQKLGLM